MKKAGKEFVVERYLSKYLSYVSTSFMLILTKSHTYILRVGMESERYHTISYCASTYQVTYIHIFYSN